MVKVISGVHARDRGTMHLSGEPFDPASPAEAIRAAGGRAEAHPGDVTAAGLADALVARAVQSFGSLSIFHANAGGARPEPMDGMTEAAYREVMTLNFDAVFLFQSMCLRLPSTSTKGPASGMPDASQ